ncbi:hypothetical protein [uncultured Maricaulis sp.]|uniref:hypothetical protein n=1 Tax=uncultured Maricaulis sp. TaxID=174710 RepID=UPI0030DB18D4|tara:strand:- start:129366 stop:129608 length:243 start_codon:yes stop_codon:yes gene_type:complete
MLARLEAEESLKAVQVHALGSGLLGASEFRKSIAQLERAAYGRPRRPAQATPAVLQAMGIGMVVLPAATAAPADQEASDV